MAKPYSEDLRRRVVEAIEGGATIPEAAEQCGVSISSVVRFLKLHRETGSISSAQFGGYKDFSLAEHEDLVRQLVAEQSDITLAELGMRLAKKKITASKSSISRFCIISSSVLKKACGRPSRTVRTSPPHVGPCGDAKRYWIRESWYLSMRPASRPQSHVSMAGRHEVNGWCKRYCMGTGRL